MSPIQRILGFVGVSHLGSSKLGRQILRGLSGAAVVKVLGALLGLLSHVVLTRVLGAEDYGSFIFVTTWMLLVSRFCRFGFDNLLVRWVAKLRVEEAWGKLRSLVRAATIHGVVTSLIFSGIIFLVLFFIDEWPDLRHRVPFCIGLLIVPVYSLLLIRQYILRGLKNVALANIPELIIRHLLLIALCGAGWLVWGDTFDARFALVASLIAFSIAAVTAIVWSHHRLPNAVHNTPSDQGSRHRDWVRLAFPFLLISGAAMLQQRIDIIMLGEMSTAFDVGLYGAARRVSIIMLFGQQIINITITPYLSELYASGRMGSLQRLAGIAAIAITAFTAVFATVLIVWGEWILLVFGNEFQLAYSILVVFAIEAILQSVFGPSAFLMMMTGQERTAFGIDMCAAAMNVILNAIAIHSYGAMGAACATATTIVARNAIHAFFAKRKIGVNATVFNLSVIKRMKR